MSQMVLIDRALKLDSLYTPEGLKVTVKERDGDTVIYYPPGTARETVGEVRKDVVQIGQLASLKQKIAAFFSDSTLQGGGSRDCPVGLKCKSGPGLVCVFNRKLSYRFFKQGGYRPNFAPITDAEAEGLVEGRLELRYLKGTGAFKVVPSATR